MVNFMDIRQSFKIPPTRDLHFYQKNELLLLKLRKCLIHGVHLKVGFRLPSRIFFKKKKKNSFLKVPSYHFNPNTMSVLMVVIEDSFR